MFNFYFLEGSNYKLVHEIHSLQNLDTLITTFYVIISELTSIIVSKERRLLFSQQSYEAYVVVYLKRLSSFFRLKSYQNPINILTNFVKVLINPSFLLRYQSFLSLKGTKH